MQSETLLEEVERLAFPILEAEGLTLVDLELRRRGRRSVLFFYVDKAGGVGIEDCRRFSGIIGDLLDVADLIPESYDLEVSSPGLDRELRKDREFRWALGKEVRCWTSVPVEGSTELRGRLAAVADASLTLEDASGRMVELPRHTVKRARLDFEFPKRIGRP